MNTEFKAYRASTGVLRVLLWSMLTATIVLAVIVASIVYGPPLEARLRPVMVEGRIISTTPLGAAQTGVELQARKVRDCDWLSTTWFIGAHGGRASFVNSRHTAAPEVRGKGLLHWQQIIVNLPDNTLRQGSYAISKHRCHPLWPSVSLLFVGDEPINLHD